jgi:hypothetical protein
MGGRNTRGWSSAEFISALASAPIATSTTAPANAIVDAEIARL